MKHTRSECGNFAANRELVQSITDPNVCTADTTSLLDIVLGNEDPVSNIEVHFHPIGLGHCLVKFCIVGHIRDKQDYPIDSTVQKELMLP